MGGEWRVVSGTKRMYMYQRWYTYAYAYLLQRYGVSTVAQKVVGPGGDVGHIRVVEVRSYDPLKSMLNVAAIVSLAGRHPLMHGFLDPLTLLGQGSVRLGQGQGQG